MRRAAFCYAGSVVIFTLVGVLGWVVGALIFPTGGGWDRSVWGPMTATAAQSLTLSGSAGDIALYGVTNDYSLADRWVEGNNSITTDFNNDARPGTSGPPKIAVGSKDFSGSSCTLGFTSRGYDAGPIDVAWEKLAIGLVVKQASASTIVPLLHHTQRMRTR